MNLVRSTTLALLATILGCTGAEPEIGQAPAPARASTGYGYELLADHVGPSAAPSAAPLAVPDRTDGRLAPETIVNVLRAGSGAFSRCYETALLATPGLAGELAVRFVIGEDGAVTAPRVERGTIPSETLSTCVLAAVGTLRFPSSSGGIATVIYPVRFEP